MDFFALQNEFYYLNFHRTRRFYLLQKHSSILFDLFNHTGTKVKSINIQNIKPGNHEMEIDFSDLPAGIYFCVLKTNEKIQTKKIVKL